MKYRYTPISILPGLVRLLRAFWPQIQRQRRLLLLACVTVSAGTVFQVLEPWPVKFVYDQIFVRAGSHIRRTPFRVNLTEWIRRCC